MDKKISPDADLTRIDFAAHIARKLAVFMLDQFEGGDEALGFGDWWEHFEYVKDPMVDYEREEVEEQDSEE